MVNPLHMKVFARAESAEEVRAVLRGWLAGRVPEQELGDAELVATEDGEDRPAIPEAARQHRPRQPRGDVGEVGEKSNVVGGPDQRGRRDRRGEQ